jgi:hypothetical protein
VVALNTVEVVEDDVGLLLDDVLEADPTARGVVTVVEAGADPDDAVLAFVFDELSPTITNRRMRPMTVARNQRRW